jgi:transcription elongation factor Elf1
MKLSILKTLIEKIKKDIKCPSCEVIFDENEVNIANVNYDDMQLEALCKKCDHVSNISVHVQKEVKNDDQKIDKVIAAVRNFKGKNIRKLFE